VIQFMPILLKLSSGVTWLLKRVLTFLGDPKIVLAISIAVLLFGYKKYVELNETYKAAQAEWEVKEAQYQQALVLERQQSKIIIKREVQIQRDIEYLNKDKSDEEREWEKNSLPESVINDFDWLYQRYPTAVYGARGAAPDVRGTK
jgi:hypothetical protein